MSTFVDDLISATPARYIFKLVSETETITCNPEPLEWASGSMQLKRDIESGGVMSVFQLDTLTFVGNGAKMLNDLFTASSVNAKCTLRIYWWKKSDRTYVEFPSSYDINFNFYSVAKVGRFAFGIRVKAVNNSVQTKLDNRMDIDIDIVKLKSIGDFTIVDYPNLKKQLIYEQTNVNFYGRLPVTLGSVPLYHTAGVVTYTAIPLTMNFSDFGTSLQSVAFVSNVANLSVIPSFFRNNLGDRVLNIGWTLVMRVTNRYVGSFPWDVQILETRESTGVTTIITTTQLFGFGGLEKSYINYGYLPISVGAGNDLKLVVRNAGINAHYMAYCDSIENFMSINTNLNIMEKVVNSPEVITDGFPLYEAIERTCQHILDVQYPIYSEFFGRTDVYKNAVGGLYSSENQLRFAHIQTGMNQRGVKISDIDSSFVLSFKKLFQCIKAIWNVGYTLEAVTGGYRIRIEQYAYFFQNVQVLDLSSRINKYDIQSAVMPELIPNDIKSGFENYEYLTVNGRGEPNTTSQRTSVMNTPSKFENKSPYRGDTKGIFDNLSNGINSESGTADTKGDSSIFIVKTQKDSVYDWKPEKGENITVATGTSLFNNELLNRYFTPTRMLIRQGNRLRAGFSKFLTSLLRFQASDKTSTLETVGLVASGSDEYTIRENEDIVVSTLAAPIYKAMKHTVEVEFNFTDLQLMQANPFGYITFSNTLSGYLLTLEKKNNEDLAKITIIEKS